VGGWRGGGEGASLGTREVEDVWVRVLGSEGVVGWVGDAGEGVAVRFREGVTGVTETHGKEGEGGTEGHWWKGGGEGG